MGRHKLEGTHRKYQVEQLWDVHHAIVRMALTGMKQVDIATVLKISPVTVSYTLRSPIVARQLEQMRAIVDLDSVDIAKEIAALAPRAVKVLEELLDNSLPNIQMKAAENILDRAGYAAVQRVKVDASVTHFTAGEIADIKNRARDIGLLVDAEYMELPAPGAMQAQACGG
jgi:predicted transcriptional regulator